MPQNTNLDSTLQAKTIGKDTAKRTALAKDLMPQTENSDFIKLKAVLQLRKEISQV